jgi:MFS family permease
LLSACVLTPVIGRLGELIAGRVIQGAAGGIYPLAFAIIRDRLPRERVPWGIGLVSSLLGIPELVQAPARLGYGFGASVTGAGLFMFPACLTRWAWADRSCCTSGRTR